VAPEAIETLDEADTAAAFWRFSVPAATVVAPE